MIETDSAMREDISPQKAIDDAVRKKRLRSSKMGSRINHLLELRDDPAALFEHPVRTVFFDLVEKALQELSLEDSRRVGIELKDMCGPYGMDLVAEIAYFALEHDEFEEVEELFDTVQYPFSNALEMEIIAGGVLIRTGRAEQP